jgi:hypothetical protein
MQLVDLYEIHEQKAKDGLLSVHPARWLYAGRIGGGVFDIFAREEEAIQVGPRLIKHFNELSEVGLGGKAREKHGYYFASSTVAQRYYRCSFGRTGPECAARDMLALLEPDAMVEVSTPVGRIDLLLPTVIVEVKAVARWKEALGQVLSYSHFYPERDRIVHLIGPQNSFSATEPARICGHYNVTLCWQSLSGGDSCTPMRLGPLVTANPSIMGTPRKRSAA